MKIENKYLRGLLGISLGFLSMASFYVLAVIISAGLRICKVVSADADFRDLITATLLIILLILTSLIFVEELKPDKKATLEKNKPMSPSPDNYHPECWDEKDLI